MVHRIHARRLKSPFLRRVYPHRLLPKGTASSRATLPPIRLVFVGTLSIRQSYAELVLRGINMVEYSNRRIMEPLR